MIRKLQREVEVFNLEINEIESQIEDLLTKAEEGIKFFFKLLKTRVCSKLIYYVKLFNIQNKCPRASSKIQRKYIDNEIRKLQDYFNDNLEF